MADKKTPFSVFGAAKTKKEQKYKLEQSSGMTTAPVKMKETPRPSYTVTDTSLSTTAKKIGRAVKAAVTMKSSPNVKNKKKK